MTPPPGGGSSGAISSARRYIELVCAQRVGPVSLKPAHYEDDDLTTIDVPQAAVGFVTGSQGSFEGAN